MEMKNKIMEKCLAVILAVVLAITIVPIIPGAINKVSAATNYITEVELNYDLDYIDLNTAWTKGEVNARVKSSMSTTTDGLHINDGSNSGLRYTPEGSSQMWGIGDGTGQIDSTSTYYIEYWLTPKNGYSWTVSTMQGNGLTVIANGVDVTSDVIFDYNVTWDGLSVFVPIGKASTKAKVTGVEIDGGDISLEKGGSHLFTGEVKGNVTNKLIKWSVEGNTSIDTTITVGGKLTIGEDETAEFINVVATADANILKRARVKVAVLDSAPTIDSITVTPNDSEVLQGKGKQFEATVEGTQLDKRVIWSVEGASDTVTTIDENGYLRVGIDETAKSITVRATSYVNPAKSGTATVKIVPLNKISKLELSYDFKHIDLNTAWTEGEVDDRVLSCIATTTEGVVVSTSSNSGLSYIPEGSSTMHGISDGNGQVDVTKSYYIRYHLALTSSDYEWITSAKDGNGTGLTVIANGIDKTSDAIIQYSSYWNDMIVYVPIGSVSTSPIVKNVTINESDVSVAAGESKTFTGKVNGTVKIKSITWLLAGNTSSDTVIDNRRGVLTVGADETAETITVIAMSDADNSKYATVEVVITGVTPTITSVAVTPDNVEILQGASQQFCVEVTGTHGDKSVKWSVVNAESDNTIIDQKGKLIVGSDETAETITVKATANQDHTKSGTATVTVKKGIPELINIADKEVTLSATSYDYDGIAKTPLVTVKDGDKVLIENTDYTVTYSNNINVGTATVTVEGKGFYCGSISKTFSIKGCAHEWNAATCTAAKKCKICGESEGSAKGHYYALTGTKNATCTANGSKSYKCSGCGITKTETIPAAGHNYKATKVNKKATTKKNGQITKKCTACGVVVKETTYRAKSISLSKTKFTYNGKTQKPIVVVKDSKGRAISSSNYKVSFSKGCKNAGTYKVTVKFKGQYSGTLKKSFKISKVKPKITASDFTKVKGDKAFSIKPTISPKGGKVTYKTSNKKVATVSSKGKVTIKGKGKATITITSASNKNCSKVTKKITVTVK